MSIFLRAVIVISISAIIYLGSTVIINTQPTAIKNDGERVKLIDNRVAGNHLYSIVISQVQKVPGAVVYKLPNNVDYVAIAERVHNSAEYYNVKTAFVEVYFDDGRVFPLVAFDTIDYGIKFLIVPFTLYDGLSREELISYFTGEKLIVKSIKLYW